MPTPERVQAYKSESTAAGGSDSEAAPYPVLIKPQTEALDSAGVYVQDASNYDYNVSITRSVNDLIFTDVTTGALALSNASNLLLNHKRAVVAASVGSNITLSGTYTLDGFSLSVGDRVLAKDQTTASENGIYIAAAGAWTRATDMDSSAKILAGLQVGVLNGTVNGGTYWRMTTTGTPTLGVTSLAFTAITRTVTAGNGLAGGGLLVNDVTLTLGTPSSITPTSTNSVSGTTHTHAIDSFDNTVKALTDLATTYPSDQVVGGQTDTTFPLGRANTLLTINSGSNTHVTQFATPYAGGSAIPDIYVRQSHSSWGGGGWTSFVKLWHDGNDGAGSGLDADLLDGLSSAAFTQVASHSALSVYGRNVNSSGSAADIAAGVTTGPFWSNGVGLGFRKDTYGAVVAPGVGNDSSQSYATGSMWNDTAASRTSFAISVGVGAAVWSSTYDGPRTCLVVGNSLEGDTLRFCDYLDPGDGTGIAAALAAGGTAKTVVVRRGTYTLAATQALLSVPAGWTLRGEGSRSTIIKPRIGNAATTPWVCVSLAGDGAGIEDIGFSIRDRAATIPGLSAPLGVISIGAKNTWVSNIYVDIPGAFAAAPETFCAVSMSTAGTYGGQVVEDVTLNLNAATITGHATLAYPIAAVALGSLLVATDVAAALPTTTSEPIFNRICVTGGQCSDVASPAYYTTGITAVALSQVVIRDCDFRGVGSGIIMLVNSGTGAVVTLGPDVRNMRVINAGGLSSGYFMGGVVFGTSESGAGTLDISRVWFDQIYNESGATGTHTPGVYMGFANTTTRDVRVTRATLRSVSSGNTDVYISSGLSWNSATMKDVFIDDCTLSPTGSGSGDISFFTTATGTVNDLVMSGNRTDTLNISGTNTIDSMIVNNRIRSASGYMNSATDTTSSGNIIG